MAFHLHRVTSLADKPHWQRDFDPRRQTLVVADLKSKLEIQKLFLRDGAVLEEDSILRATELWRKLLLRARPELRLVSSSLVTALIRQWLRDGPDEWNKGPGVARQLTQYIQQLAPILIHPEGAELIHEWFQENSMAFVRWGSWFHLAREIWNRFESEGLVAAPWASGYLAAASGRLPRWDRDLIFDLGAELTGVEVDVIKQLSRESDVHVYAPDPDWSGDYFSSLWTYHLFEDRGLTESLARRTPAPKWSADPRLKTVEFRKYTTMITEVKAVTAQVRAWIEAGLQPRRIAVCAPDIEVYWRSLRRYFDVEGIPVEKDVVSSLATYPDILHWLSAVRLRQGQLTSWDLESWMYFNRPTPNMDFARFARLFSVIYDDRDLERDADIARLFEQRFDPRSRLSREEFVAWALRQWEGGEGTDRLEFCLQRFLQDCPAQLSLHLDQWTYYLETTAARLEVPIAPGSPSGVHFVNLVSAENLDVDALYVLGVTEESLRQTESTSVTLQDVMNLSRNTGFHLNLPDTANLEFSARWLLTKPYSAAVLSFPASHFTADVQSPPFLWLLGRLQSGRDTEAVDAPGDTRWDELQRAGVPEIALIREWDEDRRRAVEAAFDCDRGRSELPAFAAKADLSLSVSQLENYLKCPFIFAANKLFHLSDLPNLDLDVDHMSRGLLMHALLEALTEEPMRFDWSDAELDAVVEACRTEVELKLGDERLWAFVKATHVDLARRFLNFEKEWRQRFPATRVVARELEVKAVWNEERREFTDSGDGVVFRGFIDRVDADGEGRYVVIDYKSSAGEVRHHTQWLAQQKLQLPLYSHWIEKGLTSLPAGPVVGAFYYVTKDFTREQGYRRTDVGETLFSSERRSASHIDQAGLKALHAGVNELVGEVVGKIRAGDFAPRPRKRTDCVECQWRSLCRASHLS